MITLHFSLLTLMFVLTFIVMVIVPVVYHCFFEDGGMFSDLCAMFLMIPCSIVTAIMWILYGVFGK